MAAALATNAASAGSSSINNSRGNCSSCPLSQTGSSPEHIIHAYGPVKRAKPDFNPNTHIVSL
jgi:hypothetical protein